MKSSTQEINNTLRAKLSGSFNDVVIHINKSGNSAKYMGSEYLCRLNKWPKGGPPVKEEPPFGSLEVNYFFRRAF